MRCFERGLARLDQKGIKKTNAQDGQKLISSHDVGFLDVFRTKMASIKSRCDLLGPDGLRPHTRAGWELTRQMQDTVDVLLSECQQLNTQMKMNNAPIRKYLGLLERVKSAVLGDA